MRALSDPGIVPVWFKRSPLSESLEVASSARKLDTVASAQQAAACMLAYIVSSRARETCS